LFDKATIERIAENANGDFRSAINDLQSFAENRIARERDKNSEKGNKEEKAFLQEESLDEFQQTRDEFLSIFDGISRAFNETSISSIKNILGKIEMPNVSSNYTWDTIIQYVIENISKVNDDPDVLAQVHELLSKADNVLGYIKRTQDWSMLPYVIEYIASSISIATRNRSRSKNKPFKDRIDAPRFRRQSESVPQFLLEKVSRTLDVSFLDAKKELIPVIKEQMKTNRKSVNDFAEWLELDSATKRKLTSWIKR
ncbi:MAG: hypothetical protein ACTSXU_00500, partial [Promethearchaeota archaeon]